LIGRRGSILWLLGHELRLDWRRRTETRGRRRWLAIVLTVGTPIFLAVFVGAPLGLALDKIGAPRGPWASVLAAAALASTFLMMLSQALSAVVDALYERSDLELLFSAPIRPGRVIAVRALAISFAVFSVFGFFAIGPLAGVAAMGHPRWLGALAVLYGCALAATGLALLAGVALIRTVGPRRTRMVGHALAVLIGSTFFLATQVSAFATPALGARWRAITALAASPAITRLPFLDWGLGALSGAPRPLVAFLGLQLSAFLIGVAAAGPQFARLYAAAAGAEAARAGPSAAGRPFRRGPFAAALAKELRLMRRDPLLIPQILFRVVYLVPLGLLAVRYGEAAEITALPGAIMALTLMTHQLSGSLAWLTISAEEAPELLATSPARPAVLMRAKICAVGLTVAAVIAPVALALLFVAPFEALVTTLACAGATLSATLLNVWWQRPGKRTAFRDRASAPWFVTLAELALALLIAPAAGLLAARQVVGLAPAIVVVGILLALRAAARPSRRPGEPVGRAGLRA
jgi:ABC-2 type transport system permease protein